MDANTSKLSSFNAAYAVAEDIYRLDPWESDVAPFVLMETAHPDAYIYVVFDCNEDNTRRIRLIMGLEGLRAYQTEEMLTNDFDADEDFSAERFVNSYDGYFLEINYNTEQMNAFELALNEGRERDITFRRQRPGFALATIADNRDIEHIHRYLLNIRKLLSQQMLTTGEDERVHLKNLNKFVFDAPAWIDNGITLERTDRFTLNRNQWMEAGESLIDEFTNARIRHMPKSDKIYELYFFYLTVTPYRQMAFPISFFLVNMETGVLEWNDVLERNPNWQENLIRKLYKFFTTEGARPESIMLAHTNLYCHIQCDLRTAGIKLEYITRSYVADELMEGYLRAARIKKQSLIDDSAPASPTVK